MPQPGEQFHKLESQPPTLASLQLPRHRGADWFGCRGMDSPALAGVQREAETHGHCGRFSFKAGVWVVAFLWLTTVYREYVEFFRRFSVDV